MGNPKAKNTRLEIDGANVASSEGRAFARGRLLPIACVVGLIGAQAWMPIIGLLSDVYRASALSLGGLSALVLPYLSTCAISAAMFSLLRARGAQTSGIYGAFVGALLTCLGTAMLLLFDGLASSKMGLLFALVGFLLGLGNSLMVMTWSLVIGRLAGKALAGVAFSVVIACCALAAFAQQAGANSVLLFATAALSVLSAVCYGFASACGEAMEHQRPVSGLGQAYCRIAVSLGLFGVLFSMMIMQFSIAPHGQASWFTWMFGFAGIAVAALLLAAGRAVRKTWDFVFAYRFVAIPVLIAFFPFDPGSDFSLKFAFWFSTLALWCFLGIAPGVLREAAAILHVPAFLTAGIGVCGLAAGAAIGYCVAWVVELIDPTPNFYINVAAIVAMALGLIGSNTVVTRGSLARAYRKASAAVGETDEVDFPLNEKVSLAVKAYGLTGRESDVLSILARGHGLSRVQDELFISEGTAITHRRHIYQKLNVHSKSELIDLVTRFEIDGCDDD